MRVSGQHLTGTAGWLLRAMLGFVIGLVLWGLAPLAPGGRTAQTLALSPVHQEIRNPDQIVEIRLGSDGYTFVRRKGGIEKLTPSGTRVWGLVSLRRQRLLSPLAVYQMTPTPEGDLLTIGVVEDVEHMMAVYRVAGDTGIVSLEGYFQDMGPIDIEAAPDGRIYLLACETAQLNQFLTGARTMKHGYRANILHELVDGELISIGLPRFFPISQPQDILRQIEDMDELRLISDPASQLYVFHRGNGMLQRIDSETGEVLGTSHLSYAGFPSQIRLTNVQFTDQETLIYSLFEIDSQGFVSGYQAYQAHLTSGTFRQLYRHQGSPDAIWETYWDAKGGRLRLIDTLGPGRKGFRHLAYFPLTEERPKAID